MSTSIWPNANGTATPIVEVIDSHTEGEPTRVVVDGAPEFGRCTAAEYRSHLAARCDHFRTAVCCEPRGADHLVGAVLLPPAEPDSVAGVVFFDNGGYLGMCGHGTIGVIRTLAHLGRIDAGIHWLETPLGRVQTILHDDGSVTFRNVPSYRFAKGVELTTASGATLTGEVAWGGNWFFLAPHPEGRLQTDSIDSLTRLATETRHALHAARICGAEGQPITHIELTCGPMSDAEDGRNFVLCPGFQYDRSPCGTGTSAKVACLAADGRLAPGRLWRQAGILGTRFLATYQFDDEGRAVVEVTGNAWITSAARLYIDPQDPLTNGILK